MCHILNTTHLFSQISVDNLAQLAHFVQPPTLNMPFIPGVLNLPNLRHTSPIVTKSNLSPYTHKPIVWSPVTVYHNLIIPYTPDAD